MKNEAGGSGLGAGKPRFEAPTPDPRTPTSVSELTERELIARIRQRLSPPPDWLLVGIGDDAAVVEPERNRLEVLSVDAIVDGVHFDRASAPADAIGHRALAVNLSDLAAMGAAPRLALLSMALPRELPIADFDAIADGLAALAARHRMHIVGGNLTRTPGPLTIDVTVMGTVKRRQAMTRDGARPGDELYVSGSLGSAAAGLGLLREVASYRSSGASHHASVTSHQASVASHQSPVTSLSSQPVGLTTDDSRLTTDDRRLVTAYLRPEPRVRLGLMLARNRAATACVDLSDGLADGVHQLAHASSVGVTIDGDALPIEPAARRFFETHGTDPAAAAMTSGDDYELLFAVRPRTRHRLRAAMRHGGATLTRIGVCTETREVILLRSGAPHPVADGYSHFR